MKFTRGGLAAVLAGVTLIASAVPLKTDVGHRRVWAVFKIINGPV
jgi:hypothetical protein